MKHDKIDKLIGFCNNMNTKKLNNMDKINIKIGDTVSYISYNKKVESTVLNKKDNYKGEEMLLLDIAASSLCRCRTWVKSKNVKLLKSI